MKFKIKKPIIISIFAFVVGQMFLEYLGFSMTFKLCYAVAFLGLFIKSTSSHNNVFVFRAIVPIVIGLGFVSLYKYLYEIPQAVEFLSASIKNDFYLERLFESLSVLYAISTAFLLWKGLEDHDNLRHVLKEESSQIQSIIGFLNYLKSQQNKQCANEIRKNLKLYIERIIKDEAIQTHEKNYLLLTETRTHVDNLKCDEQKENIAIAEIMRGLNMLFQIRMKRIGYMETRISPYILIALSFMSFAIIYVLFTSPPTENYVMETIIFILATLLSFMLMMLVDIGSPFEGYWRLKTDSFKQIIEILNKEIQINEPKNDTLHKSLVHE